MNEQLYTVRDAADILASLTGFEPQKCYNFLQNNRRPERSDESLIPFEQIGHRIYYRCDALELAATRMTKRLLRRKVRSLYGVVENNPNAAAAAFAAAGVA